MLAAYITEVQALAPPQPSATPTPHNVSETRDKETNTECAFPPGKPRTRLNGTTLAPNASSSSSSIGSSSLLLPGSSCDTIDERVVKRSQTFSPSAVVTKNRYTCRLSRSDSDSAMHHFGGAGLSSMQSFQRGATERRSLRFHSNKAAKASSSKNLYTLILTLPEALYLYISCFRNASDYSKDQSRSRTGPPGATQQAGNAQR